MQLKFKNIGMIKEADIVIDGLTVIAGENDTGKSTVGKALFLVYHDMELHSNIGKFDELLGKYKKKLYPQTENISKYIFSENSLTKDSLIEISQGEKFHKFHHYGNLYRRDINISNISFIESPLVWNLQELFRSLSDIESRLKQIGEEVEIPYPYLLKDLYFKLITKRDVKIDFINETFNDKLSEIISGEFKKDDDGLFKYHKNSKKFDLIDVATGIKTFGILQVLLQNHRLDKYSLIILDEPEVHLHPKWQLKMAEVIVELVKNGVKVVVNSHSPYMIEALERYSEKADIDNDFYLAEEGLIGKVEDNNSATLAKIFKKLSAPFDEFEKMDSEILQGG